MTIFKRTALAAFCAALTLPLVSASEWDKKTNFTFIAPVEVPGRVLPPGSYVFKLLDSSSDRHIVQIFDRGERHVIGTFLAIPDYRMTPPDKPLVTFEERAAGAPEAIKAWFYPGDNYGNQFVYPKFRAVQLAKDSHQNVPSMPSELAPNTTTAPPDQNSQTVTAMKQATISAAKPSGDEVGVAEVFLNTAPDTPPTPPATPQRTLSALASTPASASSREELPHTASPAPSLALAGTLFLVAGLFLRRQARDSR